MSIIIRLDRMMADRKISLNELADKVGITISNLSILKTGKAKAVRFSTLEAICRELNCQPGDILEYVEDKKDWIVEKLAEFIYSASFIIIVPIIYYLFHL